MTPCRHLRARGSTEAAIQPIAAKDVATAVTRAAAGEPLNGITNIAGPDKFGVDDLARIALAAHGDSREVVADSSAAYFGAVLDDRSIVPVDGEDVTIHETRFNDWAATHLASAAR